MRTSWWRLVAVLALAGAIAGCSASDRAWNDARTKGSIEAYAAYQKAFPQSPHAAAAAESVRVKKWNTALALTDPVESAAQIEAYIKEFPAAPNIAEAGKTLETLVYASEIGQLNGCVRDFFNGNAVMNKIASLNGMKFVTKDQNPSTGMVMFGTSNMRVQTEIRDPETGRKLTFVYEPKSNQMVETVMSVTPEDGATVVFTSGHRYEFGSGEWKRRS